jgi:hypothetical protein
MTHSTSNRLASSAIEMYVRRGVRQRRQAARAQPLRRLLRGVADDLGDALA